MAQKQVKWWQKTTLRNLVGAFIMTSGMCYFMYKGNMEGIMLLVGLVSRWFYEQTREQRRQ